MCMYSVCVSVRVRAFLCLLVPVRPRETVTVKAKVAPSIAPDALRSKLA